MAGVGIVMAAVVLTVVLSGHGGGSKTEAAQQVALQPVAATGPDPFTGSVAAASATPSAAVTVTGSANAGAERTVQGGAVGLYGGSGHTASCDVPKLSEFLTTDEAKGRAWAAVEGINPSTIPAYLHSLTPVVLRVDTRVTNHGFKDGVAVPFQSVLQAGTAVLVDSHGLPRVRCACGNPLLPPATAKSSTFVGTPWPGFKQEDVVVVSPAPSPVKKIVVVDPSSGASVSASAGGSTSPSGSPSRGGSSSASTSTSTSHASSGPSSGPSSGHSSGASAGASTGSNSAQRSGSSESPALQPPASAQSAPS